MSQTIPFHSIFWTGNRTRLKLVSDLFSILLLRPLRTEFLQLSRIWTQEAFLLGPGCWRGGGGGRQHVASFIGEFQDLRCRSRAFLWTSPDVCQQKIGRILIRVKQSMGHKASERLIEDKDLDIYLPVTSRQLIFEQNETSSPP